MKTNVWAAIAVVSCIVGMLVGYGASSYTGARSRERVEQRQGRGAAAPAAPAAGGDGAEEQPASAAGY